MCDHCGDNIQTISEIENIAEDKLYDIGQTLDIVIDENENFNLYLFCDDWFYNGFIGHNIHYCPWCGEKLV